MTQPEIPTPTTVRQLRDAARPTREKILNPDSLALYNGITADAPVLVVLVAGKGTRFGQEPKCIQRIHGTPLARHSIEAFHRFSPSPVICLVGYRYGEVPIFYRRFGLSPAPEFVELYPGGGAVGVRLSRYDALPQLIQRLQMSSG